MSTKAVMQQLHDEVKQASLVRRYEKQRGKP
jgi:hypothetical protein